MIPKFRAWDKELQCWCPYRIYSLNELGDNVVEFLSITQGVWYTNEELDNNFILMQSTGCRDKEGIEIYEGDVIKDKYNKVWLVSWFTGAFAITNKIPDSDGQKCAYSYFGNLSNHHFYFEVIGNIYENPELLEEVAE